MLLPLPLPVNFRLPLGVEFFCRRNPNPPRRPTAHLKTCNPLTAKDLGAITATRGCKGPLEGSVLALSTRVDSLCGPWDHEHTSHR